MKKILALVLSLSLLLAGCGGSEAKSSYKLDAEGFVAKAVEALGETDDMVQLSEEKAGDFYAIPFEGLKKATIYLSGTRATANEICVLELESEDAVSKAKEVIEKRIEEQKESYENYIPSEFEKLNGTLTSVKQVGANVVMVVGIESSDVEDILMEFVEEK